jgi:hypothetical protein
VSVFCLTVKVRTLSDSTNLVTALGMAFSELVSITVAIGDYTQNPSMCVKVILSKASYVPTSFTASRKS